MRGAFNKSYTAFHGPRSVTGPPNVQYAAGVPCRIVVQSMIFQLQFPLNLCSSWLTNDHLDLVGPKTTSPRAGDVLTDYLVADQIEVVELPDQRFIVCREELTIPFEGLPYLRYLLLDVADTAVPPWLAFFPPAPGGAAPGATCAGATLLVEDVSVSADVVTGSDHWWKFEAVSGVQYSVAITGTVGGGTGLQVFQDDCATAVTGAVSGDFTHTVFGPFPTQDYRVRVTGNGSSPYTLVVGSP